MIEQILILITATVWLFLPAGIANMAPVLFKKINFLNYPMDFGLSLFGKRIFGSHKTWRGLFFGVAAAVIAAFVQTKINFSYFNTIINYQSVNFLVLGFLLGFGALIGDAVKSFFKRQAGVKPGDMFMPFDQIDWIIGAGIFVGLYVPLSWKIWVVALVVFGLLHPLINLLGYFLKIKKNMF